MSNNENSTQTDAYESDVPRMEPWLVVTLLSIVPGMGLFILPRGALIPIYVVMAALMITGLGMFLKAEMKRKR